MTYTSVSTKYDIDPEGLYTNFSVNIINNTPEGLLEKVFPQYI